MGTLLHSSSQQAAWLRLCVCVCERVVGVLRDSKFLKSLEEE